MAATGILLCVNLTFAIVQHHLQKKGELCAPQPRVLRKDSQAEVLLPATVALQVGAPPAGHFPRLHRHTPRRHPTARVLPLSGLHASAVTCPATFLTIECSPATPDLCITMPTSALLRGVAENNTRVRSARDSTHQPHGQLIQ